MPHAPVMRATPYTPARRAGWETVRLPRSQNAAWTERQALSCRPTTGVHTAKEIEQAESLVVLLHEVLLTPRRRAGVVGRVQDGLRPGPR